MIPLPPSSTLFPYTTLFRSTVGAPAACPLTTAAALPTSTTRAPRPRSDCATTSPRRCWWVQAEGDLGAPLHAVRCRQPDTDHLVSWEIAGQAHADAFQLGGFVQFVDCGVPVNSGQQVFVLRSGL